MHLYNGRIRTAVDEPAADPLNVEYEPELHSKQSMTASGARDWPLGSRRQTLITSWVERDDMHRCAARMQHIVNP
eukprot:CAMPEP_0203892666 /NCGR_PEP_ID=MMETSP0359-20131031/35837_1 /ASSEMBLY_ACC=CAM_ASM_000338 /TAXON_ID=268821 /ORGANISM="Scrippsiella Hangoei, Strain SHTV-5" /LENGTH=74 /DNA_ID=CAMNT_0050814677 /DNA_START=120 /DNA_END=341 /DNA_ORIENTATION=-